MDPTKQAKHTLTYTESIDTRSVRLDSGDYEIWYESGGFFSTTPVVTISSSQGMPVIPSPGASETVTVNNREFHRLWPFKITSSGDYNISCSSEATLYITPPISVMGGFGICITGVLIAIVGGIVMIVGIYLHVKSKRPPQPDYAQAQAAYAAQYAQYAAQYAAQQAAQQQPGSQPPPQPGQPVPPPPGQGPPQQGQ